jgi:hypothetical protein
MTVELAVDVTKLDASSVAVMVAVLPATAPAATVTTPAALTVATAEFDEAKVSPEAGSAWDVPSL